MKIHWFNFYGFLNYLDYTGKKYDYAFQIPHL